VTDLPIDDEVLEDWLGGPVPEEKRQEIRRQSKDVASYIKGNEKFYEWFEELEGYHIREERFWDDCERGNKNELFEWLRAAFDLGFKAGRNASD
jgi:hypothetical protein